MAYGLLRLLHWKEMKRNKGSVLVSWKNLINVTEKQQHTERLGDEAVSVKVESRVTIWLL